MKKAILISTFLLPALAQAQNTTQSATAPQVSSFVVDNNHFYEVSGCVPGSDAAFYSQHGGGRQLRTITTNSAGTAFVKGDQHFTPALLVNDNSANKGGITGSGQVAYAGGPDFTLNNLTAMVHTATATLTWEAAINITADMSFVILRSTDGVSYTQAGEVKANGGGILSPYTYSEALPEATGAYYRIAVKEGATRTRYTSDPMLLQENGISIYPTLATDYIHISTSGNSNAKYTVTNSDGKRVASGRLTGTQSSIPVAMLSAGAYLITVEGEAGKTTARIMKE